VALHRSPVTNLYSLQTPEAYFVALHLFRRDQFTDPPWQPTASGVATACRHNIPHAGRPKPNESFRRLFSRPNS